MSEVLLIRDEAHLREMVIHVRRKHCETAERLFAAGCANSTARLLHAQREYIEALELDREARR